MIATWMVYSIAFGLLVIGAAHAVDRAARAIGVPARFVWLGGLVVAIALPFIMPAFGGAAPRESAGVTVGHPTAIGVTEFTTDPSTLTRLRFAGAAIDRPLAAAWLIISLLLVVRVMFAALALWRARRSWVEREIDGVSLFVTPDLGPAVVAIPDTRIIVPQWVLSLDPAALATVIRHERQHSAAGDPRLIFAGSIAAALFPWNPAVWYLRRRMRLAVEMDCDARVLAEDPRVDRYGSLLLAIAQHPRLAPRLAVMLTESTSDLERRINAMTAQPPKQPRLRAALLAAVAVGAIFVACAMPAPDLVAPKENTVNKVPANVYFDFQVEKPASANPSNQPPMYPTQLRAAGITGRVTAKFIVDTTGRADMSSFAVLSSTHDGFTAAVREALPTMRFYPAQVGGHKVKQLIMMPFAFDLVREPVSETTRPSAPAVRAPRTPTIQGPPVEVISGRQVPRPLVSNAAPVFPNQLRAANIEGQVVASVVVMADGTPDMATFEIQKSDHDAFSAAVRNAVKEWRFAPATGPDGAPVAAPLSLPFKFSLSR